MAGEFRIEGGEELRQLAKQLREAGDKDVSREFYKGLARAVRPLTRKVKASTGQFLPTRYALVLSKSLRIRTSRRQGRRNPGILFVGRAKTPKGKDRDLSSLNRGRLRHPLYGNRRHWYDQSVKPNWWDDPLIDGSPDVIKEIERAMDDVKRKLERGR